MTEINWDAITTEELNHSLGARLSQLEEQIYNLKRKELDALIAQRLLAHKLLRKDVGLATDLGRELNVPLALTNIAEQSLVEAINRGWGDKAAYTVTFLLQEEAAQVQIRAPGVDSNEAAKYISTHPNAE